jgi:tetratricopeptide (TPR) repeat protein
VTGPSWQLPSASLRARMSARYELGDCIASGGMGAIFRARDALRECDVAFKRPTLSRDHKRAQVIAQFEHEFRTLVQLAHPGIVEAYDYGVDDIGPYYTMELLDGRDLRTVAPLPVGRACKVLCEVASALALVHARRLLHRDLSPANVLLTSSGRAKLIDFGALMSFGTATSIVGTPSYVAPEYLNAVEIDQRADLYSLGALAYWILTGTRAVRADSLRDLLLDPWAQGIAAPSSYAPRVPKELDELVLALLHRDPLVRPENAAYVIDRLSGLAEPAFEEDAQRVAASYVAYPPLVGREHSLRELRRLVHQVTQRRGAAAWIEGAVGVGRSTLLERIALDAQVSGATVLRARGEQDTAPLATARALIGSALRLYPNLHAFCERQRVGLAAFCLDEQAASGGASRRLTTTAAEGYAQLLSDMQHVLLQLSRIHPLVIAVDDVHRIDSESVGLLASLAHEAADNALLLLVTAEAEHTADVSSGLPELAKRARRTALAELDEADITALVAGVFGTVPNATTIARWLWSECDGVPQRAVELLHLLLQRGLVQYRDGLFILPPELDSELNSTLERVPQARLEALGPEARRLAQLLACEAAGTPLGVLAVAMDIGAPRFFTAVEELTGRGIAGKFDGCLALASRRVRAALENGLDTQLRHDLHMRLAHATLAAGSSAEHRLAASAHLLQAGRDAEGADMLAATAEDMNDRVESMVKAVPAFERALAVYRAQGRTDLECLRLLVPLTFAGFYSDPRLSGRHLEPTYRALLALSGVALASRLRCVLGARLALAVGLAVGYLKFLVQPRAFRAQRFRHVLLALFGVAAAGTAALAAVYDPERCASIGERLSPFAALGPRSGAHAVRELCRGLAEILQSKHAACASRMRRLTARLSAPRKPRGLDERVRVQMHLGAVYVRGTFEVYAGDPVVLELAKDLELSGRRFYQPHATLLRMFHHGFRGEQASADALHESAQAQALLAGALWSVRNGVAMRQLLMYQWTRDSVGLMRVMSDLEKLSVVAPALDTHRELGQAYLELLRGRPERALSIYERLLGDGAGRRIINWQAEAAHRARAFNALGRHAEARDACLALLAEASAADRRLCFIYQPAEQELALAEASLGNLSAAERRLDRLLEEVAALGNPLLSGALHRDRCRVAQVAHEAASFELHLLKMTDCFRATRNPCLIQQCEQLAAEGASAGLSLPTTRKGRSLAMLPPKLAELLLPMDTAAGEDSSSTTAVR